VGEVNADADPGFAEYYNGSDSSWGTVHALGDLDGDGFAEVGLSAANADCASTTTVYGFSGPIGDGEVRPSGSFDALWEAPGDRRVCGISVGDEVVVMAVTLDTDDSAEVGGLSIWPYDATDWASDHTADLATGALAAGEPSQNFGFRLHFVEDLDGDGLRDLLVPNSGATVGSTPGAGAVQVISGGDLRLADEGSVLDYAVTYEGNTTTGYFGASADAADLDLDGYAELIIPAMANGADGHNVGALYLFSPDGSPADTACDRAEEIWTFPEEVGGPTDFGWTVRVAELSGDGHPDIVVGAPVYPDYTVQSGALYFFAGPFEGGYRTVDPALNRLVEGGSASDHVGWVLDTGDFDGDGAQDLLYARSAAWSSYAEGPPAAVVTYNPVGGTPDLTISGPTDHAWFGYSAAFAGDVDGDGSSDVLIGDGSAGRAFLALGAVE
jgi:hypothetical protein